MHDAEFSIETTADRVYRQFYNPRIDAGVKDWANDQLQTIQSDLDQVLQFDDGYQDFLLDYLPREVEKYRAESVEEIPYDELRRNPICTCDDLGCQLKAGRLPPAVVDAESIDDGIKRFKQVHRGSAEVLADATDAWRAKRRNCWYVLRHIEANMGEQREEPPDTGPATPSDPSEEEAQAEAGADPEVEHDQDAEQTPAVAD